MDTNGNGMLDPDEAQGPARFMLDRMARDNPKIDITKPIPMTTLTEAFQRMRSGSSGGSSYGGEDDFILSPAKTSLVPGFTTKVDKIPILGFGVSAETPSIPVEESDIREAESRMKSYDKNNDQFLDENELKEGRWSDSPMQYDKNRDGKLSLQELATRYARRRTSRSDQEQPKRDQASSSRKRDRGTDRGGDEKKEEKNPFDKTATYRVSESKAGLPEWFSKKDANQDNQVSMSEFASKWDQDAIEDFGRFDSNHDAYITIKECLAAVKKGHIPGSSSSASSSATSSSAVASGSPSATTAGVAAVGASAGGAGSDKEKADMRNWVVKRIKSKDKDGNSFLSLDEFGNDKDFVIADANKDGKVDTDEYVAFRIRLNQ